MHPVFSGPFSAKLGRSGAYVIILSAAAYLYHLAQHFQFDDVPGRIGPDAWPKLVLALLIATCAWQIARVVFVDARSPIGELQSGDLSSVDGEPASGEYARLAWLGIALTLAYAYILPTVGFLISTVLYIGALTYLGGYRRWWPLASTSLIAPIVLIFIFMKVVYLSLPLGQDPFKSLSLGLLKILGVH